jgi:membrane fusion protein (multidrug efflux system)
MWNAALGAALLVLICRCADGGQGAAIEEPGRPPTNVVTYQVRPDSLTRYSDLPATAAAWHAVTVSVLEGGVVEALLKELGDRVEKGEAMALLDAEVLEASAIQAEADLKYQRYNFDRSRKLHKEGSISEHDYYAAEYQLKRAESFVKATRSRLGFLSVKAPFSGTVAHRAIELGQLVPVGGPAFDLVQTDSIRVKTWVPENQITDFKKGNSVEIRFDAYPGTTLRASVSRVGPAGDCSRRVFPVEVHLPNADGHIRPGMISKLRAARKTYRHIAVIPREAVLERETGPVAFVDKDGSAQLRPLTLGASEGARVVVLKGLEFGERVILRGGRDLIDGDAITVTEAIGG